MKINPEMKNCPSCGDEFVSISRLYKLGYIYFVCNSCGYYKKFAKASPKKTASGLTYKIKMKKAYRSWRESQLI